MMTKPTLLVDRYDPVAERKAYAKKIQQEALFERKERKRK